MISEMTGTNKPELVPLKTDTRNGQVKVWDNTRSGLVPLPRGERVVRLWPVHVAGTCVTGEIFPREFETGEVDDLIQRMYVLKWACFFVWQGSYREGDVWKWDRIERPTSAELDRKGLRFSSRYKKVQHDPGPRGPRVRAPGPA